MAVSADARAAVRIGFGGRCGYCGVSETSVGVELEIDHFHPVAMGAPTISRTSFTPAPRATASKATMPRPAMQRRACGYFTPGGLGCDRRTARSRVKSLAFGRRLSICFAEARDEAAAATDLVYPCGMVTFPVSDVEREVDPSSHAQRRVAGRAAWLDDDRGPSHRCGGARLRPARPPAGASRPETLPVDARASYPLRFRAETA